jgi:hypothetical protein
MHGDGNFAWFWQTGATDDHETYNGPCASRDEAIDEARANDGDVEGFCIVEADRSVPSCEVFDAGWVLERYAEHNEECWSEDGGEVDCTSEQERDLEAMLAATFEAWFAKHGISRQGWMFGTSRNQEVFKAAEPVSADQ